MKSIYRFVVVLGFVCVLSHPASSQNFVWARQFGSVTNWQDENSYDVAVDNNGNVYACGLFTDSTDFDPGPGTFLLNGANGSDMFILKLDSVGSLVWVKTMGGNSNEAVFSIALDAADNVYVTGGFNSTIDFDPGPGTFIMQSGWDDIFVLKLDSSGNFIWAKQMGGTVNESAWSIAVAANGDVYTTGIFNGSPPTDFDPGPGTYYMTPVGYTDIFISKLDSSGNFEWAKQFGGVNDEVARGIAVDRYGNVYTTGEFGATVDFDPDTLNTYNLTAMSVYADVFISKLNAAGDFIWAKQIKGVGRKFGYALDVDGNGNVYTTGYFQGNVDFDPGIATYSVTSTSFTSDVFILKLDSLGRFDWERRIGGNGVDEGHSIAVDAIGNVFTVGNFEGTVDFNPVSGINYQTAAGDNDIFVSRLDQTGNFISSARMGGTWRDYGVSITTDGKGVAYITGNFNGIADFDPGAGICQFTAGNNLDFYVEKLCNSTTAIVSLSSCFRYSSPSGNHTWTSSGVYKDTIPNAAGCDSVITINLTILDVDTSVTQSGFTLSASASAATYQWLECIGGFAVINGETSQTFTGLLNGSYAAIITQNGCTDTSSCHVITGVGINEIISDITFRMIPNPTAKGKFVITSPVVIDELTITNCLGQLIYHGTPFLKDIPVELEQAGIYFVQVATARRKLTQKLMVY